MLVGALESSGDIVSVSCCDNEIFILKGDRDVIRLSDCPEGTTSDREHRCCPLLASCSTADPLHNSPGLSRSLSAVSQLSVRLATPTFLQPVGSVETAQPIRTMAIIVEGGTKEDGGGAWKRSSDGGEGEEEEEEEVSGCSRELVTWLPGEPH